MNALIVFLILCFVLGGSQSGRVVRERPIVLLGLSVLFAASFYSLRVVR